MCGCGKNASSKEESKVSKSKKANEDGDPC